MSVWPELYPVNYRTANRVPKTSITRAFCIRSTNSISYTVHIRFVCYTSVTCTWVDCSLSITCPVRMRSFQLLGWPSPPPRRLPSPDKHFCLFSVHLLSVSFIRSYVTAPLICYSTISHKNISIAKLWKNRFCKTFPQNIKWCLTFFSKCMYMIYHIDVVKETYVINGTFLDYQSFILKIPNYWKHDKNNRLVCIQTKYNVTWNFYMQYLLKEKRGCRTFYDLLQM